MIAFDQLDNLIRIDELTLGKLKALSSTHRVYLHKQILLPVNSNYFIELITKLPGLKKFKFHNSLFKMSGNRLEPL